MEERAGPCGAMGQALACLWEGGRREGFRSTPSLLARYQDSAQQAQGAAISHLNPLTEQPVPQTQHGDLDLHTGLVPQRFHENLDFLSGTLGVRQVSEFRFSQVL